MTSLINQELFKLAKKRSTVAVILIIIGLMTIFAIISKINPNQLSPMSLFTGAFSGLTWAVIALIAAASSTVAMEFEYGTVKELLYRKYSRGKVIVSKWIGLVLYSGFLFILVFAYSLVLKLLLFHNSFELFKKYSGDSHNLLTMTFFDYLAEFLSLWLILSLVFLIANLFKTAAAAVSIGIIGYFAVALIQSLMGLMIHHWHWLKWNPLNMMNISQQVLNPEVKDVTLLSIPELVIGNLVYIAIFLYAGYLIFKNRNV